MEMLEITRNRYVRIYAMEPDRKNFKKLCKNIEGKNHIYAYNNAAWCIDTQLPFSAKSGRQSSIAASRGTKYIEGRSVDSILNGNEATLIKMDVEGAEREALWGACQTIARYNPRLMVALYHRNEDLFELPLLVHKLNSKYEALYTAISFIYLHGKQIYMQLYDKINIVLLGKYNVKSVGEITKTADSI